MLYRRKSENGWLLWVGIAGVLLVTIGLIVNAVGAARLRGLQKSLASIETRKTAVYAKLSEAQRLVDQQAPKYARRWSTGFLDQLQKSDKDLRPGGNVDVALFNAQETLKKKDIATAQRFRDQADGLVKEAEKIVDRILGPPPYYSELARKDANVEGYIAQTENAISEARTTIDVLRRDPWNSSKGVVFARPYRRLDQASGQLAKARVVLATPLEDDSAVKYDRVAAYDEVTVALTMAGEAKDWAYADQKMARNADAAIENAGMSIISAEVYVLRSSYNVGQARETIVSATLTLSQARSAFIGTGSEPNYQLAYDLANNARAQADSAVWQATEPTPTPVPPPAPVYSNSDDGSSGSDYDYDSTPNGSSWDDDPGSDDSWGSDDWDSGSDDWGSDDGW